MRFPCDQKRIAPSSCDSLLAHTCKSIAHNLQWLFSMLRTHIARTQAVSSGFVGRRGVKRTIMLQKVDNAGGARGLLLAHPASTQAEAILPQVILTWPPRLRTKPP